MRLLLLIFLLLPCLARTQGTTGGFYITPSGDTVHAVFRMAAIAGHSPRRLSATTRSGDMELLPHMAVRVLMPDGTRLAGRHFRIQSMSGAVRDEAAFLFLLFEGNGFRLYRFLDDNRDVFLVEDPAGNIHELLTRKISENGQVVSDAFYRQQLLLYFSRQVQSNEKLVRQWQELRYEANDLVRFLDAVMYAPVLVPKGKLHPTEFYLMGGAAYNKLASTALNGLPGAEAPFDKTFAQVAGAGMIYYPEMHQGNTLIITQVKYYAFRNNSTFTYNNTVAEAEYSSSVWNLHVAAGRRMREAAGKWFYIGIGPALNYLAGSREKLSGREGENIHDGFAFNIIFHSGIAITRHLRAGLQLHVLPTDVQDYPSEQTLHRTAQFVLDWRFRVPKKPLKRV